MTFIKKNYFMPYRYACSKGYLEATDVTKRTPTYKFTALSIQKIEERNISISDNN